MSVETLLQLIQAIAVVIGVVFALIQLRQLRMEREIQAGIELLSPLRSPASVEAVLLLNALPNDLGGDELRKRLGQQFGPVTGVLGLFESLGPLVARGHLPIDMYAELYRGATILSWTKTKRYVLEQRNAGWPNFLEWLQWLAERMEEREPLENNAPAFERYRQWVKSADYSRLNRR